MLYFLYWLGIFILSFAAVGFWKLSISNNDNLLVPFETLQQILIVLGLVGSIILSVTIPFLNYY